MNEEFPSDIIKKKIANKNTGFLLEMLEVTKIVPDYMITEIADFRGYIFDELEKRNYNYL